MKKLMYLTMILISLLFVSVSVADDLVWDYPSDWDSVDGYTVYYTDGTGNYNKTLSKSDLTVDGGQVGYNDVEIKLNLWPSESYGLYIVAYNEFGVSEPSNTVNYQGEPYVPPTDVLPPSFPGVLGSPGSLGIQ